MIFESWDSLARTLISGLVAYPALVLVLRMSGKRTLAKMNAFDLVVTVALGSTLSAVIVSKVAIADGLAALLLLVGLQYVIAWSSVRSDRFDRLVKSEPTLLLYRGEFRSDVMRAERVAEGEVLAAIRSAGVAGREAAGAVVLESDGTISVIPSDALPPGSDLPGHLREPRREDAAARA